MFENSRLMTMSLFSWKGMMKWLALGMTVLSAGCGGSGGSGGGGFSQPENVLYYSAGSIFNFSFVDDQSTTIYSGSVSDVTNISCDADRQFFAITHDDEGDFTTEIGSVSTGQILHSFPNVKAVAIRPDGEKVALVDIDDVVTISDLNRGNSIEVTSFPDELQIQDLVFSPDGSKLLVNCFPTAWPQLLLVEANGSGQPGTYLTEDGASYFHGNFSPDGNSIVYLQWDGTDTEIWRVETNGTNRVQLTDNEFSESRPSFTQDGESLLFSKGDSNGNNHVYWMRKNGSGTQLMGEWATIIEWPLER